MNAYTILEEDMLRYVQKKFSNLGARAEDLEKMGEKQVFYCINKIFGDSYIFPSKNVG
jgi:ribosomal protein S6